jgi:hypothetical protein
MYVESSNVMMMMIDLVEVQEVKWEGGGIEPAG